MSYIPIGSDSSLLTATSTGTTLPRTLSSRFGDIVNVKDFGAKGDGVTSDGQALSSASAYAQFYGKSVFIPPGKYRIDCSGVTFSLYSGAPIRGIRGKSILLADDTGSNTGRAVSNPPNQTGDFDVQDITILGMGDTHGTTGPQPFIISDAGNVLIRNVEVTYSRSFGICVTTCASATVQGCRVYRSMADGISVSDTPNTLIDGNTVEGSDDDSISCHTNDSIVAPARSGVVITNNILSEGQGIACLGAKTLLIAGNVMRRMKAYGVYVYASPFFSGGDTPIFSLKITDNIITDVFRRPEPTPRNQEQAYIQILVGNRQAGTGVAAPGDPTGSGGTVPLLGTGKGAFYVQGTNQTTVPNPGARWLDISNNTLVRTLPACTAWADWGYGPALWVADRIPGSLYSGGVPESNMQTDGILLGGTVRNSRISGNIIETTGQRCLYLGASSGGTPSDLINSGDFDGLVISDNQFRDFSTAAIYWNAVATSNHQMVIADNIFNGDPRYVHTNRGPNGTWNSGVFPALMYGDGLSGATFERNHIRNVARLFNQHADAYSLLRDNIIFADAPYIGGYDARNKGVGFSPIPSEAYNTVQENSDPTSVLYGKILAAPTRTLGATAFSGNVTGPSGSVMGSDGVNGRINIGSGGTPYLDFNNGNVRLINDAAGKLSFAGSNGPFGSFSGSGGLSSLLSLTGSLAAIGDLTINGTSNLNGKIVLTTALSGNARTSAQLIATTVVGSGTNGPATAGTGLTINLTKNNWTTNSAAVGEIDGAYITVRQGGAGSDAAGLLIDVQNTGTGYLTGSEYSVTVLNTAANALTRGIGVQTGVLDSVNQGYYGQVLNANIGTMTTALLVQSSPGAAWTDVLRVSKSGILTTRLDDLGNVERNGTVKLGRALANRMTLGGSISGGGPAIAAEGSDTDISLVLQPKGIGKVLIGSSLQVNGSITLPGVSFGGDTANGNINIGESGAATPYLTFNNNNIRLINDAPGKLTFTGVNGSFASFIGGGGAASNLTLVGGLSVGTTITVPTPTAGDNSIKVATTQFVMAAVASINGGSSTTGSSLVIAATATASRTLTDRFRDELNILDFDPGAGLGNATADTAALTAAFSLAASSPGTVIRLPARSFTFTVPAGTIGFKLPSKTTLRGAGQAQTLITWNDDNSNTLFGSAGTSNARASDIVIEDLCITGTGATRTQASAYPILMTYTDGLTIRRCTVEWSRIMGIVARSSTEVIVNNNIVRYSARDGINLTECSLVTISDNAISHTDDDCIAVHSDTTDTWGVRRDLVISGNRIFDTQGIRVLAARQASITGNTMDAVRTMGIDLSTITPNGSTLQEGVSSALAITISGNTITNIIDRTNIDGLNGASPGIRIAGYSARAGSYAAVPGESATGTGVIKDPYAEYLANSTSTNTPTSGSYGILITGNLIARTLPACNGSDPRFTKFSSYGMGRMFTRNGWLDPILAESDMQGDCIAIAGGIVRDVLITDNILRGMAGGMVMNDAVRLENISFRGNQVIDMTTYGVLLNTTGMTRAYVDDNLFDLDPFQKSPSRGPHGTWATYAGPTAIYVQMGTGITVRRNVFRNLMRDSQIDTSAVNPGFLFKDNIIEADPSVVGPFSTANKGVGIIRVDAGVILSQVDSDPTSATYGKMLTAGVEVATSMPTTGTWLPGRMIRNAVYSGATTPFAWVRVSSGSSNVLGLDWMPLYAQSAVLGPAITVTNAANAVNGVKISGEALGNNPALSAVGSDTNIALILAGKGSGSVYAASHIVASAGIDVTGTSSFTASPILPTPIAGDSSTKAATTEYVVNALSNVSSTVISPHGGTRMVSGRYYFAGLTSSISTSDTTIVNYTPIFIPRTITATSLSIRCQNTTGAGSHNLGIYADNNGAPGARLAQTTVVYTTNTNATLTGTISLSLTSGMYWLAHQAGVATSVWILGVNNTSLLLGSDAISNMTITSGMSFSSGFQGLDAYTAPGAMPTNAITSNQLYFTAGINSIAKYPVIWLGV